MPESGTNTPATPTSRPTRLTRIAFILNLLLLIGLALAIGVMLSEILRFRKQASEQLADVSAVRAVLDAQVAAWNREDIDGFMEGYWQDEGLTFISGGNITQGFAPTRERFVKRYKLGKATMGKLSFNEIMIESLSATAALVRGRYELVLPEKTDWGRFSLILRQFSDGWIIAHDHTSVPLPDEQKK